MKKSIRILSLLMAFAMLIGSFSVMGNAYQAYKDGAVSYNDVDAPEFTTEQYASMGLDEVDRMLLKEKIELDIFIGKLDLGSIDTTLASVVSLVASVQNLLPLLGDASALPTYIEPIKTVRRSTNTDVQVIQALFNFIANLAPLAEKYVTGTAEGGPGVSLGILNSFVADFLFDVRELAIGLLFGLTEEGKAMGELDENGEPEGYDYFDDGIEALPDAYLKKEGTNVVGVSDTAGVTLLQNLINDLVLGEWKLLDDYFDDPYSVVNYNFYGFKTDKNYNETKPDTKTYDYYGWVHPKDWVTVGLGGYKRVTAGTAAPAADYKNLDINAGTKGYDFVETLLQAAYNNLLIPVLNRDTVRWVREDLCGIEYLDKYAKRTLFGDDPATDIVEGEGDVPGVWYNNPTYDPSYAGEEFDLATLREESVFAWLFDIQNVTKLEPAEIPAGTTLIDNFNNLVGEVLHAAALEEVVVDGVTCTWTWEEGDNSKLLTNVCDVLRFVLQVTGEEFFGSTAFKEDFPTVAEIGEMNDQQAVSMVLRGILNSSVDYIYVEPEYQTLVDVAYRAVEQLAYQDIPQFTYTKPVRTNFGTDLAYYQAVIDKMLDILFDIAVYNLNQGMDMEPASGKNPKDFVGLLQYQGDNGSYETNLVKIAAWAFEDYAPLLSVYKDLLIPKETELTKEDADKVWMDIDTIINALIPIKSGSDPWISNTIASKSIVSKAFIFEHILEPVYTLNATNLAEIFAKNTPDGAFAKMDGIAIIIKILQNVFDLLFPGVFQSKATIDEIVENALLGDMVSDLLKSLGTESFTSSTGATIQGRANDIMLVGLPIVCMVLGLSDDQEFEEMEIYLPETISASGDIPTFEVINGSSGINTFHTDVNGNETQDKLYEYKIKEVILNQYDATGKQVYTLNHSGLNENQTLSGGDVVNVSLSGTRNVGDVIEFTVNYWIFGEDGTEITDDLLSKTVYSYVGDTDEDDDNITLEETIGDRKIEYSDSIYLSEGDGLGDIEGYSIRIRDDKSGSATTASVTNVTMTSSDPSNYKDLYPFVIKNDGRDDDKKTTESMTGEEGIYFLYPFVVKEKAAGEYYERYEDFYQVDEETGEVVIDKTTEKPIVVGNNNGVKDGQYNIETVVNVAGTEKTLTTAIHLYDDFGLESMFNRAVAANRQQANYDMKSQSGVGETLWANYRNALMAAARLALMPKEGTTFAAAIEATNSNYVNRYEELAVALEESIEALEEMALDSGINGLKTAIGKVSGNNYTTSTSTGTTADGQVYTIIEKEDIEYYDSKYVHFGMRDYVPHTYNRYKDARRLAEDIINSQEFFAPENPAEREYYTPTAEEIQEYNEAMEEYAQRRLNMEPVNAIEATYAIHMVELTASRLIRLDGNTSKLQIVYNTYANENTASGNFVGDSKEDYDNAVAFAAKVLAKADPLPSEINTATTKLVKAWKNLDESGDYTNVIAALEKAQPTVDANGKDPAAQFIYTEDSYRAFMNAYNEALRAKDTKPYGKTVEEQEKIDQVAQDLYDAIDALVVADSGEEGGDEPVIDFVTVAPGVFFDHKFKMSFTPQLAAGTITQDSYYGMATLADGVTPVDGFICGYGAYALYDEATALKAFNYENCNVVVTPNALGTYSSGTIIQFYDDNNTLLKTYIVVLIGDVTGDAMYDGQDAGLILEKEANLHKWEWLNNGQEYRMVAGDINNDGYADNNDAFCLRMIDANRGNINQEVSVPYTSSFIEA